ncbi:MAG: N-acetylneuraminate synthase [Desulfobacteraceae bacterium]|nr:N-acetylneuraminate synthase [Desulfobacteraceae bacterium]
MMVFGNCRLGRGEPCFITFEAGATHDGLSSAMELSSLAAEAGADAIKFQIFDPDRLVADKQMLFSYGVLVDRDTGDTGETATVSEPLYDILCRRYLSSQEWIQVKKHCDALGLAFFATVGFESDIQLLEQLKCDSIKIASADINHWPLIRRAAETGMCIQLDTGNASLGEIEQAVEICRTAGNTDIIIHNCPSGYPARLESINLNLIVTLKQMFPEFPIAYSDHTPGWEMDVAAVALGVDLLEKTITKDRTIRGPEHMFSLEPGMMKSFVQTIRDIETAMGRPRRILHPEEKKMRQKIRRSTYLKVDVKQGDLIGLDQVEFRRPGTGISPDRFEALSGRQLVRDLEKGQMLTPADLKNP